MSLCSLSTSDRIATRASCSGSEGFDVGPALDLPQTATGQLVSLACSVHMSTDIFVDCFFVHLI